MDKKLIKDFAIEARQTLIMGVTSRLSRLGITNQKIEEVNQIDTTLIEIASTGARYSGKEIVNRFKLVEELNKREEQTGKYELAFNNLVEEVAYTWFNRLVAIRFMEVNDYLPEKLRVLSSVTIGKKEPDIVTNILDTELFSQMDLETRNKVIELLTDGSAAAVDELYQIIFIKQCNSLNSQLPDLFERIDDYSELLFSISYIDENGVVASLLTIPESDFDVKKEGQVEIIGWMYQYYNTEPKDKVFARGSRKIRADEIPAATQLFTPDWIVRYMVENSLGRYYIDQKLGNPNETRSEKEIADEFGWKYYLPTAEQPQDVQIQLQIERKEKSAFALQELKLIDPSMGSGHILVYAFDVFMQLYLAEGELPRRAAEIVLEKNLFGLDIDKRAFQLAYFALMMKGRQYSKQILSKKIIPNVYAVPDSIGITEVELQLIHANFPDQGKAYQDLLTLVNGFKHGQELGSLIEFNGIDFKNIELGFRDDTVTFLDQAISKIISIGKMLQRKYTIAITNPPYMGSAGMDNSLAQYVKKRYPDSKSDLFGVFIERLYKMVTFHGYYAMITQHAWMFLSSFEKLRIKINDQTIINMAHLGTRAFEEIGGEVVQTTSFVMSPTHVSNFAGSYIRLVDINNANDKKETILKLIEKGDNKLLYNTVQNSFSRIPGQPISYWASENLIKDFVIGKRMNEIVTPKQGLATADNNRFLREWWEVDVCKIKFDADSIADAQQSGKKWFPYNKGGAFRRWYGNYDYVVNWENDGQEIRNFVDEKGKLRSRPQNTEYYFKEAITWPLITSAGLSSRFREMGSIHDVSGMSAFSTNQSHILLALGLTNSKIGNTVLKILNPTINSQIGDFQNIPLLVKDKEIILEKVRGNIAISKKDWNNYELAWEFQASPLL